MFVYNAMRGYGKKETTCVLGVVKYVENNATICTYNASIIDAFNLLNKSNNLIDEKIIDLKHITGISKYHTQYRSMNAGPLYMLTELLFPGSCLIL